MFYKRRCSWKFRKIHRKIPAAESFFKSNCRPKKETLAQVFSSRCCEISKKTFLQNTSWRLLLEKVDTNEYSNESECEDCDAEVESHNKDEKNLMRANIIDQKIVWSIPSIRKLQIFQVYIRKIKETVSILLVQNI